MGILPHGGMTSWPQFPIGQFATDHLSYCPPSVAMHCLFICTCMALLRSGMYIERSIRGAKDPYGSFACSHAALGTLLILYGSFTCSPAALIQQIGVYSSPDCKELLPRLSQHDPALLRRVFGASDVILGSVLGLGSGKCPKLAIYSGIVRYCAQWWF
jgi:hypothetical protein